MPRRPRSRPIARSPRWPALGGAVRTASWGAMALALSLSVMPARSNAQRPARRPVTVPIVAASTQDVGTIDGIVKAYYDVISGPKGAPRQWSRDRTLYIRDIRFAVLGERDGKPEVILQSHQDYVDASDSAMVANGFFEMEIGRKTTRFGHVAQVASAYESRSTPTGKVFARGVNMLQLYWDGTRWWISGVTWDDERANNPIPKELIGRR